MSRGASVDADSCNCFAWGTAIRLRSELEYPVKQDAVVVIGMPATTRTEEGRRAAQARGVPFGRPPKLRPDQRALARHLIEEGKFVSEVARTFNVHVATIYRCLHDQAAL